MDIEIASSPFQFVTEQPCPYYEDGRTSVLEIVMVEEMKDGLFHDFLQKGFRRIGPLVYRNVCTDCCACIPIRLDVSRFVPSRSQKRTLRRNRDVRIELVSPPSVTHEKILLYSKYVTSKHGEKGKGLDYHYGVLIRIHFGFERTVEMDYYIGDRLIGVGIVDEDEEALSANYFYYDTDFLYRRPGIYSCLQEIELARRRGRRYYYLGFYIENHSKMAYKKFFRPNEVLRNGTWQDFMQ